MADIDTNVPGTFCWPELMTTDQKGAVGFYRGLFGWDVDEQPIGPEETYSMFKMRNRTLGAAGTLRPEQRAQGVPPHWGSYVCVTSADQTAARAQQLGGSVLVPPFDVMEHGRMAVVQDSTGAVFSLWQAKAHPGAQVLGEPGALCWTELSSRDPKASEAFYTQLFGWTAKTGGAGTSFEYTEFSNQGKPGMGMMRRPADMPTYVPDHWLVYFQSADVDATTAKAKSLGAAKVVVPPTDIANVGRFSVVADPQGAVFATFKPAARG
jgi:predicted enzyme related to lactoylglutathione lyase